LLHQTTFIQSGTTLALNLCHITIGPRICPNEIEAKIVSAGQYKNPRVIPKFYQKEPKQTRASRISGDNNYQLRHVWNPQMKSKNENENNHSPIIRILNRLICTKRLLNPTHIRVSPCNENIARSIIGPNRLSNTIHLLALAVCINGEPEISGERKDSQESTAVRAICSSHHWSASHIHKLSM
jgi:hypothetical protein